MEPKNLGEEVEDFKQAEEGQSKIQKQKKKGFDRVAYQREYMRRRRAAR